MNEEKNIEPKLVQYIIDRQEIALPMALLKQKMILEAENALNSTDPLIVSHFFKNVSKNLDGYVSSEDIIKLTKKLKELSMNEKFKQKISEDDKRIIKFLVENTSLTNLDIIEIMGQEYFTIQVAEELEETKDLPNTIKMALFLWCFVNIYEIILINVDRRLFAYIKNNNIKESNNIKRFLDIDRKEHKDHATAGLINKVFCEILDLKEENNSIFGKDSKPKLIRNKISHSNIFYDTEENKIKLSNGEEYSIEDFLNEYYALFNFLMEWINIGLGKELDDKIIFNTLKKTFHALSSHYLRIERGDPLKRGFYSYIIKIKKEAGVEDE
jgi:hypothetical protein